MIKDVIKYVSYFFDETKQQHHRFDDVILKSALVYKYLFHKHFNTYKSVSDILELNNGEIGLLGPGNSYITLLLERTLGWVNVLHSHGILHDAFGRFYNHHSLDRGYTYIIPENRTPDYMRRNPLCGQVIGLLYCLIGRIII